MTESERPELFAALTELAQRYPHWRMGQLICNLAGATDINVWDIEDEQLLAAARDFLKQAAERDRTPAVFSPPMPRVS